MFLFAHKTASNTTKQLAQGVYRCSKSCPRWISHPKKQCTPSDKSNLLLLTDNISKGAFYFMLGVPLTQTQALQLSWPIRTQTQTNLRPTASDRVWVTSCNTFSSDLSLIENGRFRFLCRVLQLPLLYDTEKGRVSVRSHLSGLRRLLPSASESIPKLLFAREDRESSTDSSGWLLWVLWEKNSGLGIAAGRFPEKGALEGGKKYSKLRCKDKFFSSRRLN